MDKTPSKANPGAGNTAQRLRRLLGVPDVRRHRKAGKLVREQLVFEAIEPRVLLSGEVLVLPPAPPPVTQQITQQELGQVLGLHAATAVSADPSVALNPAAVHQANEVVFVDPRVQDYQALLNQALSARGLQDPARVDVVVLDTQTDGVTQIANWLSQYTGQPLRAVHLLTHGESGQVQLGGTLLDNAGLATHADTLARWGQGLTAEADILIYGCDVAQGAQGEAFVATLSKLTGADVAASVNRTGAQALGGDWLLERQAGVIDAAALQAASWQGVLALDASTLQLNSTLRTQLLAVLEKVDAIGAAGLASATLNADLPGLGKSVNELIGLDTDATAGVNTALFGSVSLRDTAGTYFTAQGDNATLQGLSAALSTAVQGALPTGNGRAWVVAFTPSFDPAAHEVVAGLKLKIDLTDWSLAGQSFGDIAGFTESGTLTTVANFHFDADVGLTVTGVGDSTNSAAALSGAATTDLNSWFTLNKFEVQTLVTAPTFEARAGIQASLADPQDTDHLHRMSLVDFASLSGGSVSAKAASALSVDIIAALYGNDGSQFLVGHVSGDVLSAQSQADIALDSTAIGQLRNAFSAAGTVLSKADALSALGIKLPMADVSLGSLLSTSDGRTFSDVLSLRTADGTSVLDTYLAGTGSPSVGGLVRHITQYLTGTGAYAGLEAMMSASAAAAFMNVGLTGTSSSFALNLNLRYARQFVSRFTFGDKLKGLGVDWLPGQGVGLLADVNFDATWFADASAGIQVQTLQARVSNPGGQLDAGVAIGVLDARAVGTLTFDTAVNLDVGSAQRISQAGAAAAVVSVSGTPTIQAAADFDLVGSIGSTSFATVVGAVNVDTSTGELVVTSGPTVGPALLDTQGSTSTGDDTLTFTGTATLASGKSLVVQVGGSMHVVATNNAGSYSLGTGGTFDATQGTWSLRLDRSAVNGSDTVQAFVGTVGSGASAIQRDSGTQLSGTVSPVMTSGQRLYAMVNGVASQLLAGTSPNLGGVSYNSSSGAWAWTTTTTPSDSLLAFVSDAVATGQLVQDILRPSYASTPTAKPTVEHLVTSATQVVLTGLAAVSTGQSMAVSVYLGSEASGTLVGRYELGAGVLSYDGSSHRWTLKLPTALANGTYSVKVEVSQVPHVEMVFGNGSTSVAPVAVNLSGVGALSLQSSLTGADALRKFAALDSATLSNMLTDLGTYLQMLRDSGQFNAVLPYTNVTLGQVLDFSAIFNDITDAKLVSVMTSGITAGQVISPVLTQNVSFDLQFQRPGDTRTTVVTVTVLASETTGFTHINQLAELIDTRLATACGGLLTYAPGDGTVATAAVADVQEAVQGGLALGSLPRSNEVQNVTLHASGGTFTLSFNGQTTGPLSVSAGSVEVQHALEKLGNIGLGNVVVTGTPKRYSVEFTGELAHQDTSALTVAFQNATVGGVLDVLTSGLALSDGVVKGKLNILENLPGTLSELKVAPSAGAVVQGIVAGSTTGSGADAVKTAAVQRLTIAYGVGGSITLSGKKADGTTAFTTGNISLDLSGAWSTRIETALNAALGYASSATGVSVAVVSPSVVATNQGVQAFDITFNGSSVTGLAFDTFMATVPTTGAEAVLSRPGVQVGAVELRAAEAATGTNLVGTAEVQRLVIANASLTSGNFSLSFTQNGKSYQSDTVQLSGGSTATSVASALHTVLVSMLRQAHPELIDPADVTVSVGVNQPGTGTFAFDVTLGGALAGTNVPQLVINPVALTPAGSTSVSYGNLTGAGFAKGGQDNQRTAVTTFTTLNDMVAIFQQAVNAQLPQGATFSVNPRFDPATSSFLFDLKFAPTAAVQSVALTVPGTVGSMSGLKADATLDLSASAYFEGTVGFDFRQLNTFALQASGAPRAVITAGQAVEAAQLNDIANTGTSGTQLTLVLGDDWVSGNSYTLTLPKTNYNGSSGTAYTHSSLLAAVQTALNGLTAQGDLADRGFTTVGQAVTASWTERAGKQYLTFTVKATLNSVVIDDRDTDGVTTDDVVDDSRLGFVAAGAGGASPVLNLPSNGRLGSDATFSLVVDGTQAVSVTVTAAATSGNTSVADLLVDINNALSAVSVSGHSYLGSAGLGFANLGQVVQMYQASNGQLQLITLTPKVGSLQVQVASEADSATQELGFQTGQKSRTSGADVFLQNVTLGGDWSGQVHDQTQSTDTTLKAPGAVSTGMLDLNFNQLSADYQGSLRFELRHDASQNTTQNNDVRLSLNTDLFNAVTSQVAQLGMGGDLNTTTDDVLTSTPVQSNGRLLRDLGLAVTVAGAGANGTDLVLHVTLTVADTADNTSINDLAADLDRAMAQAVHDAGVTSIPHVGQSGLSATTNTVAAGSSGTVYKGQYGYVGVYTFYDDNNTTNTTSDDSTTLHLQFFAPTLGSAQAGLTVAEHLLVAQTVTPLVFGRNTDTAYAAQTGATAGLTFGSLGLDVPDSLRSLANVTTGTTLTVNVSNLADVLAGADAVTSQSIVPATGLGVLTPLADINWSDLASQFAGLPELFGSLSGLGQYGELGRLLPLLGTSVSDIFGLGDRLSAIQEGLAALDGSLVGTIASVGNSTQVQDHDLAQDATFSLAFDSEPAYDLVLPKGSTSRADLVADLQRLLDTTAVQDDSALSKLGYAKLGQAVSAQLNRTTQQIELVTRANVQSVTLSAASTSTFVTELGFQTSATVTPSNSHVSLASLQAVLANAFGNNDVALSVDTTAGAEALRLKVPYVVTVDQSVALKILFNDEFTKLLSAADQAKLADLAGTVTAITDGDLNAPMRLTATIAFNFDFGVDLARTLPNSNTANPAFGQLFLYDHHAVGAAGLSDDTGTFATISLSASATGMNFDNNIGLMTLHVQDGSASVTLSNTALTLDKDSNGTVDRVYLNDYDTLHDTGTATGATRGAVTALDTFRRDNIDVVFDGTALAQLPMTLVLSDDLGQLAMDNLTGFINPMPIGTMALNFADIGGSLRSATDQSLHIDVATSTYLANTLVITYNGQGVTVPIAASTSTHDGDTVTDAQIKAVLAEAVAVAIQGAKNTWGSTDYAAQVGVTGNRGTGFSITLNGSLASTYAQAMANTPLTIQVVDAAGVVRGWYGTANPTVSNNTVTSVSFAGVPLSDGVIPAQQVVLSTTQGNVVSTQTLTLAPSDALTGLVSDNQVQRALADAALKLIFGGNAPNQTLSGIKVAATGETTYLSYRDAKQSITFPASTGNDVTAIQEAFSRLLTGGTGAANLVSVTGTRAGGFTVVLSGSLASDNAGEIRVTTRDGVVIRQALVKVTGNRTAGFDVVIGSTVADVLGTQTLSAAVKDLGRTVASTASGSGTVSGVTPGNGAATLVFSFPFMDSVQITLGASTDGAGLRSEADIKSAIQAAVSTTLTGSAASASLVTVGGDRASGYSITLTGTLLSGHTGALQVQVLSHQVGATQSTSVRGNPQALVTQVKEAYQPEVAGSVNTGTGSGTPEGVPQDVDREGSLSQVNTNPYSNASGGSGATSAPVNGTAPTQATSGTAPNSQPSAAGQDISYVLPDLSHWQDLMLDVLKKAGGLSADPSDLSSFPLIFLLRDPTVLLNSLDTIFGGIQSGLEKAVAGIGKLPLIGDQMVKMTGAGGALDFIIDLRANILGSLKEALASTIDVYGGLDNAMRMWLFDVLTTDTNADGVIDDVDKASNGYNPWLNFVNDYNGDGIITPDDIVVEYLIGEKQDLSALKLPPGLSIQAFDAGQRSFWVTAGTNVQIGALSGQSTTGSGANTVSQATLTAQPVTYGGYTLGFTIGSGEDAQVFQTQEIAPDATADVIQSRLQTMLDAALLAYHQLYPDDSTVLASTVTVTDGTDPGTFTIAISGGSLPGALSVVASDYTTDAGSLVLDGSMEGIIESNEAKTGTPVAVLQGNTLTLDQQAEDGQFKLGFSYTVDGKTVSIETVDIASNSSAWGIQKALQSALDNAIESYADDRGVSASTLAQTVHVTGGANGVFTITLGSGTSPGTLSLTATDYSGFNRLAFLNSVLKVTTGVQFRMNLGLSYSPPIPDFNFDIGVDGLPLYFTASGGLGIDITWETYLGFGVDIKDGFFINANMPSAAGIGAVTEYDSHGHAVGIKDNAEDPRFSYLFAVGKMDYALLQQGMMGAFLEHPEEANYYKYLRTDELVLGIDVHLNGTDLDGDGNEDAPFSAEGQLLFLNAKIHDDWSGYVQDNTGAYWGDISKSAEPLWVKGDRVLLSSAAYQGAAVKAADSSDTSGLYGFIVPDDVIHQNGHDVDDPRYDLDYAALNTQYKSDHGGQNLFYIDASGYLRYAVPYVVGNAASVDKQSFAQGDHVQQRKPNGRPLPNGVTPLGSRLFKDETGIDGSRTHLHFELAMDIQDPGEAGQKLGKVGGGIGLVDDGGIQNGRLTLAKLSGAKLSDLIVFKAESRAQVNLVVELGLGLDGSGYLPSIHGGFHMLWGWETSSAKDEAATSKYAMFNAQYDKLFPTEAAEGAKLAKPSIWLTDIALDMGTFASNFLVPVAKKMQQVIAPIQPVIDALTTTIPGLDQVMGRPYSLLDLAQDLSKTFGGNAKVDFVIAVVRMAETISKIPTDAANLVIPVTDVLVLSGEANRQFNLSPVKGVLGSLDVTSATAGIPGQTTVSLSQGMQNLGNALKKPGNALKFPVLTDPFGTTINLLLGKPADLVTFTPPKLEVAVGFRISFPVFPPLSVGLGGEIKVQANLTLGFDTYGITEALKTGNWLNVLNGFYVSDNIVNGVDVPEIILTTKIYVFAELNLGLVRGGVEGGIKFVGTLDLVDPNNDGKVRAFEIASAVAENPLDLIAAHLRFSAYISAYVDVFALFSYVRVFEYTFMDVTLFEWDFDPSLKKPVLATMDGSVLVLNTGNTVGSIDGNAAITQQASDRLRRDTADGNENYTLTGMGGSIQISAVLPNGQTYTQNFSAISAVRGYAGNSNDTLDASGVDVPVYFVAGAGTDVLIGGSGNDTLVGSSSGTAILRGNGGDDRLIARGGTTTLAGGAGSDVYRFLGNWGQATLVDGNATDSLGENTLDFSAQTASVRLDDAYSNATQGNNRVVWSTATSVDQVKGGSGSDTLDFSGREDNLTLSVTGTNAGWVTGTATGDSSVSNFSRSAVQTTIGSRGFRFEGFENAVGGQGSDVFYIRDGASLTGSLYGDTSTGLHHDGTTGNENANARNTIDFSDYTSSVTVHEEALSAFGSAGAKNITVRGMHNIFGGSADDTLIGDGRNNLIVGNGGADVLEGRAMHDLLVADTFVTWSNDASAPSNPGTVNNYVRLEAVGLAAGFAGNDGRRWIWLGQTLENRSQTTGSQVMKGGSGNDIEMGALGNDVFNVGGSGEGNDVIMADLGRIVVDYQYRTALQAYTKGAGGGNDVIYLGGGSNLVLAGSGNDSIIGSDKADSMNIVLADNGEVKFQSSRQTVEGTPNKLTLDSSEDLATPNNHLLDYALTTLNENGAQSGGRDVVSLQSGSALVLGGGGADTITFSAVASTGANVRWVAGDHARVDADQNGSIVNFQTTDVSEDTGGADRIGIGQSNDSNQRYLGSNYVLAGMGADVVTVSAALNADTGVVTFGAARSTDVILGDNGQITRPAGSPYLAQVVSTQVSATVGGNDVIAVANGDKTIIGGQGADRILVNTSDDFTTTDGGFVRLIAGDNAQIDYDALGQFISFKTTDVAQATGGADDIRLGNNLSTAALGLNVIFGGMAADQIYVSALHDDTARLDRIGASLSQDIIVGDNGVVLRSASTGSIPNQLLQVLSTQTDKGGNDRILTANGSKVLVGGFGADVIRAQDGDNLVMGDNAQIDYDTVASNGVLRSVQSLDIVIGGDDAITLAEGFKLVSGGYGADTITINADNIASAGSTVTSSDATGAAVWSSVGGSMVLTRVSSVVGVAGATDANSPGKRGRTGRFVAGDNVRFGFDDQSGLTEMSTTDPIEATGGADTVVLGDSNLSAGTNLGLQVVMGGVSADAITVQEQALSEDILVGDNASFLREARNYAPVSLTSTVTEIGGADVLSTGRGDKIMVGGFGADTFTARTVDGNGVVNRSIVLGDAGQLAWSGGGLTRVESLAWAMGGDDRATLGDGDVTFVGGYGRDTLAVDANTTAFRIAAGDNALLQFAGTTNVAQQAESLISAQTLDQVSSTGDGDVLRLGLAGSLTGNMGQAILLGGVGADALTVTGAQADSLILGDNGQIDVARGTPDTGAQVAMRWSNGGNTAYIETVASLQPELGAGDVIDTVSGRHVLIGGQGGDVITAGRGDGVVFGDSARLSYTLGVLRQATSVGLGQGGNDTLNLGAGGSVDDGHRIVVGGVGADQITVLSVQGSSSTDLRERMVAGDNVAVTLDTSGRLGSFTTLDSDNATGGADTILLSVAGSGSVQGNNTITPGLTDLNVVAGGMAADTITISSAARYVGVASGDNLDYRRQAGGSLYAGVLQPYTGGDDTLRLSAGDLTVFGGAGADRIEANTTVGDRSIVFGDAGSVNFMDDGSGRLAQLNTMADDGGGADTVNIGSGRVYLFGGAGRDALTVSGTDAETRVVLGDTGQVDFTAGQPGLIQTSYDQADANTSADTIAVPSGTGGRNFVIGGAGVDNLRGDVGSNDRVLAGSGMIDAAAGRVVSVTVLGATGEFGYRLAPDGTAVDPQLYPGALYGRIDGLELVSRDAVNGGGNTGGGNTGDITYALTGEGTVRDGITQLAGGRIAFPALTIGLATFPEGSYAGQYGSLTMSRDGSWYYVVAGASATNTRNTQIANVQALATDEVRQEVFYVTTDDGSTTTVSITVQGNPLQVQTSAGAAREAGGVANATPGQDLSVGAAPGVFHDAVGATANGQAIVQVGLVSSVGQQSAGQAGSPVVGLYGTLTVQTDGSYAYLLNNNAAATQGLAEGQTAQDIFHIEVVRDGGRTVTATLTLTVTGTNDLPVAEQTDLTGAVTEQLDAAVTLSDSGTIGFADVDLRDVHHVSTVAPVGTTLGSLTASVSTQANDADGTGGVLTWQYSLANAAVKYLAEGQTRTESFVVTLSDDQGGTVQRTVSVTLTGTNDDPVVAVNDLSGNVTEAVSPVGNLSDSGTIGFADVDLRDTHSVSVIPGQGVLGTLSAVVQAQASDTDGQGGVIAWTYTVPADQVEYLAAGETRVEQFTVRLSDGQGGVIDRLVSVTVTGTADDPVVATQDLTGLVTELGTPAGQLSDSGSIAFTDIDLTNAHSVTVTGTSANPLGQLTPVVTTDTTAAGTGGVIGWTYTVNADRLEYLAAGETRVETFTITLADSDGATVSRNISVTLLGTNDAPVAAVQAGVATEDLPLTVPAAGLLTGATDVDVADVLQVAGVAAGVQGTPGSARTAVGVYGTLVAQADGSYRYDVNTAAGQALAEGDTATDTFRFRVSDGQGGESVQTLTLTVQGRNDAATFGGQTTAAVQGSTLTTIQGQVAVNDADHNQSAFVPTTLAGQYGVLVMAADGQWRYTFNPVLIAPGLTADDLLQFSTVDGTVLTMTITVTATDVVAVGTASATTGAIVTVLPEAPGLGGGSGAGLASVGAPVALRAERVADRVVDILVQTDPSLAMATGANISGLSEVSGGGMGRSLIVGLTVEVDGQGDRLGVSIDAGANTGIEPIGLTVGRERFIPTFKSSFLSSEIGANILSSHKPVRTEFTTQYEEGQLQQSEPVSQSGTDDSWAQPPMDGVWAQTEQAQPQAEAEGSEVNLAWLGAVGVGVGSQRIQWDAPQRDQARPAQRRRGRLTPVT